MNKIQKDYAMAKALKDTLHKEIAEAEKAFIKDRNIINPDGTVPSLLYMIDDLDTFDKACEEFENLHPDLLKSSTDAEKALKEAENTLIDWGLSIAPADVRKTLDDHKNDFRFRGRLIDLAFRLDARTLPRRKEGAMA